MWVKSIKILRGGRWVTSSTRKTLTLIFLFLCYPTKRDWLKSSVGLKRCEAGYFVAKRNACFIIPLFMIAQQMTIFCDSFLRWRCSYTGQYWFKSRAGRERWDIRYTENRFDIFWCHIPLFYYPIIDSYLNRALEVRSELLRTGKMLVLSFLYFIFLLPWCSQA